MSKGVKYITESLGSCGFAVLHGRVAYTQRSDMWATASDCSYDLSAKQLENRLGNIHGCSTYLVRFEGIESPLIKVLARSGDQLAQRIHWVTGFKVRQLMLESEMAGTLDQPEVRVRRKGADGGDRYRGVITAEGPRTCSSCDRHTIGGSCIAAADSGIHTPAPNEPRRCVSYKPTYESHDGRTGAQLWPELVPTKA